MAHSVPEAMVLMKQCARDLSVPTKRAENRAEALEMLDAIRELQDRFEANPLFRGRAPWKRYVRHEFGDLFREVREELAWATRPPPDAP